MAPTGVVPAVLVLLIWTKSLSMLLCASVAYSAGDAELKILALSHTVYIMYKDTDEAELSFSL